MGGEAVRIPPSGPFAGDPLRWHAIHVLARHLGLAEEELIERVQPTSPLRPLGSPGANGPYFRVIATQDGLPELAEWNGSQWRTYAWPWFAQESLVRFWDGTVTTGPGAPYGFDVAFGSPGRWQGRVGVVSYPAFNCAAALELVRDDLETVAVRERYFFGAPAFCIPDGLVRYSRREFTPAPSTTYDYVDEGFGGAQGVAVSQLGDDVPAVLQGYWSGNPTPTTTLVVVLGNGPAGGNVGMIVFPSAPNAGRLELSSVLGSQAVNLVQNINTGGGPVVSGSATFELNADNRTATYTDPASDATVMERLQ